MLFYVVLLFILILLCVTLKTKRINGKNSFLIFSFVILAFLYTVRGQSVGWDSKNYMDIFMSAPSMKVFHSYLEPGWVFLIKIIYMISNTQYMYFFTIGIIGIGCYYLSVKKLSENPDWSIILYFMLGNYFNLMNQERIQIAVSICMFSFWFLYKKNYISAFIIVFLACTIHESAFIFLAFIIFDIVVKKYSYKLYMLVSAGVLFVFLMYDKLFMLLTRYFYTSYTTESTLIRHTKGGNLKIFLIFAVFLVILFFADKKSWENGDNTYRIKVRNTELNRVGDDPSRLRKLLYTAVLFAMALQFISIKNAMIARFSNYFSVYFTILIPNVLGRIRNTKVRWQYGFLLFLILFAYMVIYLVFSENGFGRDGVVPYIFHWMEV